MVAYLQIYVKKHNVSQIQISKNKSMMIIKWRNKENVK